MNNKRDKIKDAGYEKHYVYNAHYHLIWCTKNLYKNNLLTLNLFWTKNLIFLSNPAGLFSFDNAKVATFLLSLQLLPRKNIQKRHILDPNQGCCVRTQRITHILAVALTFVSNYNNNDGKAQLHFLNESKMAFKEK